METSFEAMPGVTSSPMPDGTIVLLDANSDEIYELNPEAAFVWKLLASESQDRECLVDAAVAEFPTPRVKLSDDIDELLKVLTSHGLIRSSPA